MIGTRPRAGAELPAVGRAKRFASTRGTGSTIELYCLAKGEDGVARRLVKLGFGFESWGEDEEGVFLVRRVPSATVDSLEKGERIEGLAALAKVRDVAGALATCESNAIFPGPLRASDVALGSAGRTDAFVLCDTYVRALLGAPAHGGTTAPSPRWTPPEQAAGAPWDNAANRYVVGLVAYRLIAGAHPFSGVGLRDAMSAQVVAPPPFVEEIAKTLRPGIQSLVLAMLDPDPKKRPATAAAIVARCEELLRGDEPRARPAAAAVEAPIAPRVAEKPAPKAPRPRLAMLAIPIAAGLFFAIAGVAMSSPEAKPKELPKPVLREASVLTKTNAEACGACHARQVAEWQRSVMAHATKSPLFGSLESVVEEQVANDESCRNGAGVLRRRGGDACRDEKTGLATTGTGGEHWCVNCHAAGDNLKSTMPAWSNRSRESQKPLRDLLSTQALEGISCAVCHQTIGPVHGTAYDGNPTWTSPVTGDVFRMRPEDGRGAFGISNSGYLLDPSVLLASSLGKGGPGDPIVHRRAPAEASRYLASSEFCGACHDVRLFGTDTVGIKERGEHFKRLRNAYSEWRSWADAEKAAGRQAASCQDCHMSLYPGVCVQNTEKQGARDGCPPGFHFEKRSPGERAKGVAASSSGEPKRIASHYFTSVDVPLAAEFPEAWATDASLDASGVPLGLEARREQLLRHTFRFALGRGTAIGSRVEIPIEIENVGAGHRVPAGFSQEREIWVELTVKDARGAVVYEVGKIASDDSDLKDKSFVRVTTRDDNRDFKGRPLGVFGADVVDGPDLPRWNPNPSFGGTTFRGRGLINMQNGFLRCVRCIGFIDAQGRCQPGPGQGRTRADRFDDGIYDIDTGECRSNLFGSNALFETYFPVGALDADRGVAKAPDAIIDTRSAPPGVTLRYTYEIDAVGHPPPFRVEARLRFRPFPPFLLRAFADYESRKAAEGRRPSGPQLVPQMLRRNHPVDLAEASTTIDR